MGTTVPRIQVTLKPETYALISRLAGLQQGSKSRIIAELVDEVAPHLQTMLDLLEAASSVKADRREQVRADAESLLDLMMPHAEEAHAALDKMASLLSPEDEAGPPSSNTGVVEGVSDCNPTKRRKSA